MLVVQKVSVEWTKHSRGGKFAALRNSVPSALELPPTQFRLPYVLHEAKTGEANFASWQHQLHEDELKPSLEIGGAHAYCHSDHIDVRFAWETWTVGAPQRSSRTVFTLRPGQIGRLIYNGRFSCDGHWWYRRVTLNLAFVEKPNRRMFRKLTPDFIADEQAILK